jgi:hypothetical protein
MAAWTVFQAARSRLGPSDPGIAETRERWLLPLFSELGFGRLAPTRAIELDGRTYPVSHDWGSVPIHLVGAGVGLDQRSAGVAGAARVSPHGLIQEVLNASPGRLWGFVSNGLQLRLLRDSAAITRQAFVEFDLEDMMEGEVYSDFALLWLVAHQSRLEGEQPEGCWLERWSQLAIEQGTRALDRLRDGVEAAITSLGRGFLAEPANRTLRGRLHGGALDRQGYYRQLLRLVYRLIFLMVAEDRDLLHPPSAPPEVRKIYADHYSMGRLRHLAERRRGTLHSDLYEGLAIVMGALDREDGLPALGLPVLGSFLWRREAIADLADARLRNRDLLEAVSALAFTTDGRIRRAVDYRNLGSEELGSVYESLLELHPELNLAAGTFALATAGGHERKLTGSYYTPTSLITCLLDTALTPVLDEAVKASDPEAALLALKVLDPACGSGHFLVAAAHRIAKRLAAIRTGDSEPAPEALRRALRDVIGHCIHGVDMNDMAVELCKVSLWMEAIDPGRPLSFLDHRIVLGDSLLGTTPSLLQQGIPDAAFRPIEGDDPMVARSWLRHNREEREGQLRLGFDKDTTATVALANRAQELEELSDDDIRTVAEKERRYREMLASTELERARLGADAWCAAFVAEKVKGAPEITEDLRHRLASDPSTAPVPGRDAVWAIAAAYRFLHWHLAFPNVFAHPAHGVEADNPVAGWSGGFDLVIGNPPWERVKLQEQEWFANRDREIADLAGARRKRRIQELTAADPSLHDAFVRALRHSEGISHLLRNSGRYPLCGRGDVNTYSVFAESMRGVLSPIGGAGIIVPTGIATDDTAKAFFGDLVEKRALASLFDFENEALVFPNVHHSYRFCLLTFVGSARPVATGAEFAFLARAVSDLADDGRRFRLSRDDFRLLNPNTRTAPIFRTRRDAEITRNVYERVPVLLDDSRPDGNPWGIRFMTMFHMTNDSGLFRTRAELQAEGWGLHGNVFARGSDRYLPLYEAKMFHHYDHRWATYDGDATRYVTSDEKSDPEFVVQPRYWVPEPEVTARLGGSPRGVLLAFRDITRSNNERTMVSCLLPVVGVGNNAPLVAPGSSHDTKLHCLAANLSSLVLDFLARSKVGGVHLNFFIVEQLAVLPPQSFDASPSWTGGDSISEWMKSRLVDLCNTAVDIAPWARTIGRTRDGHRWIESERATLRADLDAAFFHLYGFSREDTEFALDSFYVLRDRETRQFGAFVTKDLVLNCFDKLAALSTSEVPIA